MYVTSRELHAADIESDNGTYANEDVFTVGEGARCRGDEGQGPGYPMRRQTVSPSGRGIRLALILLGAAMAASAHAGPDIEVLRNGIVRILTESVTEEGTFRGSGSGFIINDTGLIGTNHHVIAGATEVEVHISGSTSRLPAEVLTADEGLDVALLRAPGLGGAPVSLSTAQPGVGDEVFALGFPGHAGSGGTDAVELTFTAGVIGRLTHQPWNMGGPQTPLDIIQHSAEINRGNSGGPLVNACGAVVGVNTAAPPTRIHQDAETSQIVVDPPAGIFYASRITELVAILEGRDEPFGRDDTVCVSQVEETQQQVEETQEQVDSLQDNIDETTVQITEAMRQRDRRFWMMSALMALAVALALAFALRKPRGQIVRAVGQAAERLSQVVQDRRQGRPRRGIAMSGFLADGQPMNVMLAGRRFAHQGHGLTVGRNPALVDAVLSDAHVSRRHLRVRWAGKGFEVEDLNSSNGTVLNGQRLAPFEPCPLGTGDLIRIGRLELQVSMA